MSTPRSKKGRTAADVAHFETDALRFCYPSNWTLEVDANDDGVAVTLQSPGVNFGIVGIYAETENPQDLVDQAVDSLRQEHPGLEVEDVFTGEWPDNAAAEAVFLSLDTLSYCWLRSGRLAGHTVLVMLQSVERESTIAQLVFDAICASVEPVG